MQFTGREKTGICRNAAADAGVDLVPKFGEQDFIFWGLGYFFDMTAIHSITDGIISQVFQIAREVFLVSGEALSYNKQRKQVKV